MLSPREKSNNHPFLQLHSLAGFRETSIKFRASLRTSSDNWRQSHWSGNPFLPPLLRYQDFNVLTCLEPEQDAVWQYIIHETIDLSGQYALPFTLDQLSPHFED